MFDNQPASKVSLAVAGKGVYIWLSNVAQGRYKAFWLYSVLQT